MRTVMENINGIKAIYNERLRIIRRLDGKIVVSFEVDGIGKVQNAKITESTIEDSIFQDEMLNLIENLKFNNMGSECPTVKLKYPFVFDRSKPDPKIERWTRIIERKKKGPRSSKSIARVLIKNEGVINSLCCKYWEIKGFISIIISINPNGDIIGIKEKTDKLENREFKDDFINLIKNIKFHKERKTDDNTEFYFPFSFAENSFGCK